MSSFKIIIALLVSTMFFAACGGGGSNGGNPNQPNGPGNFSSFSCEQANDKGAQLAGGSIASTNTKSSPFFGKLFNQDYLEVMFSLTPEETWDYAINVLKVPVYKVTLVRNQTSIFDLLPEAPADDRNTWNQASGGSPNTQLAGLYTHYETMGQPQKINDPTIMVKTNTDRWTLVHEIMHHVFNLGRRKGNNYRLNMDLRNELTMKSNELEKLEAEYNADRTDAKFLKMITVFREVLPILRELSVRSNLEEVSIEGTLIECAQAGRLEDANPSNINSALWYIDYSVNDAVNTYGDFRTEAHKFLDEAQEMGFANSITESKALLEIIEMYVKEAKALVEKVNQNATNERALYSPQMVEAMALLVAPDKVEHLHYHKRQWQKEREQILDALNFRY